MKARDIFAKILAITGLIFVGFPILLPVVTSISGLFNRLHFNFDYLLPAELFPFVILGGVSLLVAAIMARKKIKLIAWEFGALILTLALLIVVPLATGLSSGAAQPTGFLGFAAGAALVLYWLAATALLVGGIILLIALFKRKPVLTTG